MFCGARARARPEDIEGVYAHLFFVLLSVFELGSPSDVVQNGGRHGRQLMHVLWECMLKFCDVCYCGGVCPLFLSMWERMLIVLRMICGCVCSLS